MIKIRLLLDVKDASIHNFVTKGKTLVIEISSTSYVSIVVLRGMSIADKVHNIQR